MSDFSTETLEHTRIIELVRAFSENIADEEGKCNGFTSMWLQAVLQGEEQEKQFYARLNRFSNYLPGLNIEKMPENFVENPDPKEVIGKIYVNKEGGYVAYTYGFDGVTLIKNQGSILSGNAEKDKELLTDIEGYDENHNKKWFKHTVLNAVSTKMIENLKKEVERIFKSKVYNLALITDEVRSGSKLPEENTIYFEKKDNKLNYSVLDRKTKDKVINGSCDIEIEADELTAEKLDSLRSKILASIKNEDIRTKEENKLTPVELDLVEMRAFAENVVIQQAPNEMGVFDSYVNQNMKSRVSALTASANQGDKSMNATPLGVVIGLKKEIKNYFKEVEKEIHSLSLQNNSERISFLLGSENHAVGVYYDIRSKKWHFLDVNHLSGKSNYYSPLDSAGLADHLFHSFFDDDTKRTLFSITRLTLNGAEATDKLNKRINDISTQLAKEGSRRFLPDKTNTRDTNALCLAAMTGQEGIVDELIKKHASINKKNKNGNTPLMLAVQNGYIEIVKKLLNEGASVKVAKKDTGSTLLMMAALQGHAEIVELLLQKKAVHDQIKDKDSNGMSVLMYAVLNGDLKTLDVLLKSENIIKQINEQDKNGWTALMHAVKKGNQHVIKILIDNGADLKIKSHSGSDPIMIAVINSMNDIVKTLIENNADLHLPYNKEALTPTMLAAMLGNFDLVKYLSDKKPEVLKDQCNSKNGTNSKNTINTVLTVAAQYGYAQIVDEIINKVENIDEQMLALKLLAEHKDILKLNDEDLLLYATENGYNEIAKTVLKKMGKATAFSLLSAKSLKNQILVNAFLEAGIDADSLNKPTRSTGYTQLIYYAKYGQIDFVKILIQTGADLNIQVVPGKRNTIDAGKTALDLAIENNQIEIAEILKAAGAKTQSELEMVESNVSSSLNIHLSSEAPFTPVLLSSPKPKAISAESDKNVIRDSNVKKSDNGPVVFSMPERNTQELSEKPEESSQKKEEPNSPKKTGPDP